MLLSGLWRGAKAGFRTSERSRSSLGLRLSTRRLTFFFFGSVWFSFPVSLGLDISDTNRQNLDVYKEHFEAAFLESTRSYYKAESEAFVAANSVSDYLKKAQERLKEEETRVDRYLHGDTRKLVSQRKRLWGQSVGEREVEGRR